MNEPTSRARAMDWLWKNTKMDKIMAVEVFANYRAELSGYGVAELLSTYAEAELARLREARWIPVEEKLPGEQGNDSETVLCFLNGNCELVDFDKRGGGGWGIRLGFYDAKKGAFRCGGIVDRYVTHWRPLPPPPEVTK